MEIYAKSMQMMWKDNWKWIIIDFSFKTKKKPNIWKKKLAEKKILMFCDLLDFICTSKQSTKSPKEDHHRQQKQLLEQQGEAAREGQNESHHCQQPITNRHGLHRIYNEHLFNSFHGKLTIGGLHQIHSIAVKCRLWTNLRSVSLWAWLRIA